MKRRPRITALVLLGACTVSHAQTTQEAYLKASNTPPIPFNPNAGDRFSVVAVSGGTVVVGAPNEDSSSTGVNGDESDNSLGDAGAAYVFVRNGTTWTQQAYLKASSTDSGDSFGVAVGVSGDTVVVGASFEKSNATGVDGDQTDNSLAFAGAAYVFEIPTALAAAVAQVSLATGGQQVLTLDAGPSRASWYYWILGSATGTSPGIDFGGGVVLPLEPDAYFTLTLTKPFLAVFGGFLGQLDSAGLGSATLTVPSGFDPGLAGITLNHAYLASPVLSGASFASNPVSVLLAP